MIENRANAANTGNTQQERIRITMSVGTITRSLLLASVVLIVLSYSGQLAVSIFDWHPERDVVSFFNVDRERNLPTSLQSLLLLGCAAGVAAIAVMKRLARDRWTRHWAVLSVIFAGLAWDEIAEIHERFIEPMRRAFDLQGIFFFGWIIPAGIALTIVALAYLRFFLALEPRTRTLFLVAATVFLSGALILEGAGGWYYERIDQNADMLYVTIATIEESLEMAGMIIFLHAVLSYLSALLASGFITLHSERGILAIEARGDAVTGRGTIRREAGATSRRELQ